MQDTTQQTTPILTALSSVLDPNTGKDFVSTKQIKNLSFLNGDVSFDLELGYPAKSQHALLRRALITAAKGVTGVTNVSVQINMNNEEQPIEREDVFIQYKDTLAIVGALSIFLSFCYVVRAAGLVN